MLNKKPLFLLTFCFSLLLSTSATYNISTYTYKTVGDISILLDVYTPPSPPPKDGYPIFFAIHAGGYVTGSKDEVFYDPQIPEIMKRNWAIVTVDYRLLPSVFLEDIVEDIQDAYFWVRNELPKRTPVNPDLITMFGQSAGGGLALISGYKFQPRPKAIIGFYSGRPNWTDPNTYNPETPVNPLLVAAVNKLTVPVQTEYSTDFENNTRLELYFASKVDGKFGWMAVTHDPNLPVNEVMRRLKAMSAAENVGEDYPATYLAHGLADSIVPYQQSVQMAESLEKRNISYVLDLIPGADHGFDGDPGLFEKHVLPAFDFAEKYMKAGERVKKGSLAVKFLEN